MFYVLGASRLFLGLQGRLVDGGARTQSDSSQQEQSMTLRLSACFSVKGWLCLHMLRFSESPGASLAFERTGLSSAL